MTSDEAQIWLFAVTLIALAAWTAHFILALWDWRRERTARSFGTFYIATMVLAGMISIALSRAQRTWPTALFLEDVALIVAPILAWLLLSGGVVALWAWRSPGRRL